MSVYSKSQQNRLKKQAAHAAVEFIKSGNVIGLGTGSTTRFAILELAERLQSKKLQKIVGIASSKKTERLAQKLGIPLVDFESHPHIDLVIDGADEVDPDLNLIKGGGAAMLREKVLAQASSCNVIILDDSKVSARLGLKSDLPVEVLPFAWPAEMEYIKLLGGKPELRRKADGKILKTDQGNYILDCRFEEMENPEQLEFQLNQRAGIIAHGLFIGLTTDVIIAGTNGCKHLIKK